MEKSKSKKFTPTVVVKGNKKFTVTNPTQLAAFKQAGYTIQGKGKDAKDKNDKDSKGD